MEDFHILKDMPKHQGAQSSSVPSVHKKQSGCVCHVYLPLIPSVPGGPGGPAGPVAPSIPSTPGGP